MLDLKIAALFALKMVKIEKKFSPSGSLFGTELEEAIRRLTRGLYYTSETDAEIVPVRAGNADNVLNEKFFERFTNDSGERPLEKTGFGDFFDRLTIAQDWHGEKERERAERFGELRRVLEENLTELNVYRIGRINIDIYVLGRDREGNLAGIKTEAVET